MIAAVVHEASSRHRNLWFPPDGLALSLEGLVTKSWLLKTGASGSLPRSTKERKCSSTSHWETAASVPASESWDGRCYPRSRVNDWISMSGSEIGIRPRPIFKIKTRRSTFVTIESPRDRSGRGKDPASERLKPELGRWSGRRDSNPCFTRSKNQQSAVLLSKMKIQ